MPFMPCNRRDIAVMGVVPSAYAGTTSLTRNSSDRRLLERRANTIRCSSMPRAVHNLTLHRAGEGLSDRRAWVRCPTTLLTRTD